jgi:hypothetical protein
MRSRKKYLGDSVYAEVVDENIRLTTENGEGPTNIIWLDVETFSALMKFVDEEVGTND